MIPILWSVALFLGVNAQFPPKPEGVTTITSKFHKDVKISYKEPGICETTPGVKSYSGYVHLPPKFLLGEWEDVQDYPINTFFWFFESRKDPANAPLSIWLNGGPGGSSMMGLLQENGPCFVSSDSNSTYLNEWSWNNEVNMLYIDQPVQVGFSYDTPTNCTVDLAISEDDLLGQARPIPPGDDIPAQNNTFFVGTVGSQNPKYTANSTAHAAHAIWHFAQTWFEEFPFYKPNDEKISIWTESYGGKYGPSFASFFEEQNDKIANGIITTPGAHYLHIDTLGIVNGCQDWYESGSAYPDFAYNNTYGIQAYNETQYKNVTHNWEKPGGGKDKFQKCRDLAVEKDPKNIGNNDEVTAACKASGDALFELIEPYMETRKHGWYDITHPGADPFPPQYLIGYLNQHWVQGALGVPVNYTPASWSVASAFNDQGDGAKEGPLTQLSTILERGVKVALVYGDRDFACNWIGGERSSLKINYTGSANFSSAGYTPIFTDDAVERGQVRQYGNYSFSRVYQAGHLVPSYQPEVAYNLFMRSLFNKDLATGLLNINNEYKTTGPDNTWHIKNEVPESPNPVCYILNPETCTDEQYETVKNGTAIIENWIVVGVKTEGQVLPDDGEAQEFLGRLELR
ncbi:putative carboxypeptidase S1 [Bisporella sp. PMI_857]|nr:putative carboxypeptidase S1 [Bisporella sp. PMI_857]